VLCLLANDNLYQPDSQEVSVKSNQIHLADQSLLDQMSVLTQSEQVFEGPIRRSVSTFWQNNRTGTKSLSTGKLGGSGVLIYLTNTAFILGYLDSISKLRSLPLRYDRHWLLAVMAGLSRKDWIQARCDGVPVSAWTGTLLPRWSPHPSLWCCSSPRLSTICQPELSHCASLSTQHVRLSGVRLCRPDSLELAAWWT